MSEAAGVLRHESGPNIVTDGKKDLGPLDFTGKFAGKGLTPGWVLSILVKLLLLFLCFFLFSLCGALVSYD